MKKKRQNVLLLILPALIFFCTPSIAAGERKSIFIGHSLTPTTETLKKGRAMFGSFATGYGLTEKLTVGTSTWMLLSYNMYNAFVRLKTSTISGWQTGLQAAYFKTGTYYPNFYRMEAASVWAMAKKQISPSYKIYLSGNFMYFWDETIPFSLRREPFNQQPFQFTATSLHEVSLVNDWSIAAEAGVLGLNYKYPQMFIGISARLQKNSWLFQFGVSENQSLDGLNKIYSQEQYRSAEDRVTDRSLHPEFQVQYFF